MVESKLLLKFSLNKGMERRVRIGVNSKVWLFEKYEDYLADKLAQPFGDLIDSWVNSWKVWRYAERRGLYGGKEDFGN